MANAGTRHVSQNRRSSSTSAEVEKAMAGATVSNNPIRRVASPALPPPTFDDGAVHEQPAAAEPAVRAPPRG